MKTVITSEGDNLNSAFDVRFGRAAWFCVYNHETKETEFIKNPYTNAQGGAGTKTAEKMVEISVKKVISGDFGPKAKDLLNKFKIQMIIIANENYNVQDIIDKIEK